MDVQVGRLQEVTPDNKHIKDPSALLLEVDPRDSVEVELLEKVIRTHFPDTPVIATASDITLPDIRLLMRLGVVDVLPQPIAEADLKTALDLAGRVKVRDSGVPGESGKVISFLKGGGGVGATTLAVQSACLLAGGAKASKSMEHNVCVMDLDLQFGTAALYLDLEGKFDYQDLVAAPKRLDRELLNGVLARHETGVSVLPTPLDVLPLDTLTPDFIGACLKVARKEFRYTVLDLPEAWTTWSCSALENSDLVVLVTQMTVAGIRQARRQLNTLRDQGLSELPVRVVINRFDKGWGKTVRVKEAEKSLGRKIDDYIVSDYRTVSEAINLGVPLSKVKRNSKVEKGIRKLVDQFVNEEVVESGRVEPRIKI
ncbi:MAG: hypothetical protein AAF495_21400 [Pseudomonadota bacterium]